MDYSQFDDATLMGFIAQERSDALSVLYDRYGGLVYSIALALVHDRLTAEEITLDVFTQAWEKGRSYRADRAQVSTWLASLARYRAIDRLRRLNARPEGHAVTWSEAGPEAATPDPAPEEAVALAMQKRRVQVAIRQLPEEQRQALALAFLRGYTHRQIAKALDQPLGTVKTRIRLAMQKLRVLLQAELE